MADETIETSHQTLSSEKSLEMTLREVGCTDEQIAVQLRQHRKLSCLSLAITLAVLGLLSVIVLVVLINTQV
jgi:hypothetical protein